MGVQPPSGGCVLKLGNLKEEMELCGQPPSGGCVLKQALIDAAVAAAVQPPSGGCVLKHMTSPVTVIMLPAAFGRLCVETGRHKRRL